MCQERVKVLYLFLFSYNCFIPDSSTLLSVWYTWTDRVSGMFPVEFERRHVPLHSRAPPHSGMSFHSCIPFLTLFPIIFSHQVSLLCFVYLCWATMLPWIMPALSHNPSDWWDMEMVFFSCRDSISYFLPYQGSLL